MKCFVTILLAATVVVGACTTAYSAESDHNHLTVYNKGIGGQNSQEGINRFRKDVLDVKPHYVFIYFGLNDALNEKKFLSEEAYINNLTAMIEAARKANIEPVICTIHHVTEAELLKRHKKENYGAEGPNGKITRYNVALRKLAAAQSVKVADFDHVVSSWQEQNNPLISSDGVHLTPHGYNLLAQCFYNVVADTIKGNPTTIVCLGDSVTWGAGVNGSGTTDGETYPAYLAHLPLK